MDNAVQKFNTIVRSVTWERIYMYLTIEVDDAYVGTEDIHFYLANADRKVEAAFDVLSFDGNCYRLKLNVTNNGTNRCVNNGVYTILTVVGDVAVSEAGYSGTSQTLESWARAYRYSNNSGTYAITFLLDEYAEESRFQLLFYNSVTMPMRNLVPMPIHADLESDDMIVPAEKNQKNVPDKIAGILKKKAKSILKHKAPKWRRKRFDRWHNASRKKSNCKKTILFMSEQDDQLALNMQVLLQRMKERELDKKYNITYSLRKATSEPQTKKSNANMLRKVAEADIIIIDDHVPLFNSLVLPKDIKVIQIWHAGAGFKGVGYSRWGHAGCPGPFSCHRQYTFSISGSANISEFFSEQFGILDEQIIPTGMPRMDTYLNEENRRKLTNKLHQRYPQIEGNKVILFAPTYRGRDRANAYYPYEKLDFSELYGFCRDNNYVVMFKMHPWVSESVPIPEEYSDRFFDLNEYPNINDLFYVTDLLVTDYSSSIYEFSLMDKPMLFFAYDKEQYSTSRGFHRDYDSTVPGKVCKTFDEVMDALRSGDLQVEKVEKYKKDHFDFVDDHASDRVIDWLIIGDLPEQYRKALDDKRAAVEAVRGLDFSKYFD